MIHKPVKVELCDGQSFVDHVKTVVTESGQDFVVFHDHARMPVAQIADCEPTSHAHPVTCARFTRRHSGWFRAGRLRGSCAALEPESSARETTGAGRVRAVCGRGVRRPL